MILALKAPPAHPAPVSGEGTKENTLVLPGQATLSISSVLPQDGRGVDRGLIVQHDLHAKPDTLTRARAVRKQQTDADIKLWSLLRRGQIGGQHFRKQVPIGPFVADFACLEKRLIVEADGGQHAWRNGPDTERTRQLETLGYKVLRVLNTDILHNPESVVARLHQALNETSDDHAEAH